MGETDRNASGVTGAIGIYDYWRDARFDESVGKERPSKANPLWQIAFELRHEQPLTILHP